MAKIANKEMICQVLLEKAREQKDIIVLCSDSRGSASMTPFAKAFPEQFVECGIAEQDLVGIAAGLARAGKKSYAFSPACFISARSYEQCKVDVAYSNTNVKLIGISGGVSYGALGMSHHSLQDIASMCAIPNMRVYIPSDANQTKKLIEALLNDNKPAYIRVGRNAVEEVYETGSTPFTLDRATVLSEGSDVVLVAAGEMVAAAKAAGQELNSQGVKTAVLDMYCVKPFDSGTLLKYAAGARLVVSVEEHSAYGGLGALTAQTVAAACPRKVINLAIPDEPVVSGTSKQIFDHYGLNAEGIVKTVKANL